MTTLADFYSQISSEIRRGTSLDSFIASKVQQAVTWFESQHTFLHMQHYADVPIDADASTPRAIALPTGFKKMLAWRVLLPNDEEENVYYNIKKVDFYDVSKVDEGRPEAYWQDGMDYFWLDKTPDQDYDSEMAYLAFTTLGNDTGAAPYVIQTFPSLILNATMVLFAPLMRDANVVNLYKPERDTMMKAAIDSDIESRQGWQSENVIYGHEFIEEINSEGDQP